MADALKIGAADSPLGRLLAEQTRIELEHAGIESILVLTPQSPQTALLRGDIDVAIHCLQHLPTSPGDNGLAISALSRREKAADLLLLHPDAVVAGKIFRLKEGASMLAGAPMQRAQMLDFRPDTNVSVAAQAEPEFLLEELMKGRTNAVIVPAALSAHLLQGKEALTVIELNPREFVPVPGQGVIAWQAHREDVPTRRLLQRIHHPEVSALTNVERRVQQLAGDATPLSVHCHRDAGGNYHISAACVRHEQLLRIHLSQSTKAGLAEKVFGEIMREN
ncbi:MAG: hypothetical protein U0U46_08030 [Saprospiraceae bacterium]|nr:hypothetical protein [Saprospiraceae bacterium]